MKKRWWEIRLGPFLLDSLGSNPGPAIDSFPIHSFIPHVFPKRYSPSACSALFPARCGTALNDTPVTNKSPALELTVQWERQTGFQTVTTQSRQGWD